MRHNALSVTSLFFLLALSLTACAGTAPAVPVAESIPATDAPIPSVTPAPTEVPPPPCLIAFDSDRDDNREIYVMEPDGGNPLNLTNHPADDWSPAWSPDGSRIAFVSDRENDHGSVQCIYVMNADGSDAHELIEDYYNDHPDWSPDGKRITFTSREDIYITNADGSGQPLNLTESPEKDAFPVWSPDGSQIAWLSGDDGNWQIFVMNVDGSGKRQLTGSGQINGVAWTVDGRLFTHWQNDEAACSNCVMDPDGGNISDAGGKGDLVRYFPFWTADGQPVEVANVDFFTGDHEIYLVGEIFPDMFLNLTNHPAQDLNPHWPALCAPTGTP